MDESLNKKWFIAQIKPNSYNCAIRNLERQGFETFLPTMAKTQRKKDKFIFKNEYVFPGYMFVCFDPRTLSWTRINSTYGVSKILAFNKKPAEISSHLILELKKRYQVSINRTKKVNLKEGDTIKFYEGPFVDLIAKVENVDKNNRIWVLLESMCGKHRVKLKNVEKNKYDKL
jgi:transcriptional antiterminator RfaH